MIRKQWSSMPAWGMIIASYGTRDAIVPQRIYHTLQSFNRHFAAGLAWLAGATLGALVAVVLFDVVCRQFLNSPVLWPSEVAILLFIWSVISGAAVAAYRRTHFVVDVFTGRLSEALERALDYLVIGFALLFALVVVRYGAEMAADGLKRFTPMNGYRMIYHFVAFPLFGTAVLFFEIERLLALLLGVEIADRAVSVQSDSEEGRTE